MIVTVIFPDKTVNIDGVVHDVTLPNIQSHNEIYSIVWDTSWGEVDYNDGNLPVRIGPMEYTNFVAPYVSAWEASHKLALKEETEREAAYYAMYQSPEALQKRFRHERDKRLSKTDFYFQPDYPAISEENMKRVKAYRIALRDMTSLDGFPWDGGGKETPWPVLTLK